MAYTQKLAENKYKIVVDMGFNDRGKRIRKSKTVTVTSDRDLKNKTRDFEIDCHTKKDDPIDKISFEGFVKRWWKNYVLIELVESTHYTYEYLLDKYISDYFNGMKLINIKKFHVVEFLGEITSNKKNIYIILMSIFTKAVEWEILNESPMKNMKQPKTKSKQADYYREREIIHLFNVLEDCYPKHRIIVKLAVVGGLRRGEILGITEENINFDEGYILIEQQLQYHASEKYMYISDTKGKTDRKVYLPEKLMQEIKRYHVEFKARRLEMGNLWKVFEYKGKKYNLLFVKENGYPALPNSIGQSWRELIKKYNLRSITFHELRHSSASFLVKRNAHPKMIQERLGHSDVRITMQTYSHIEDEEEKEVANAFNDIL